MDTPKFRQVGIVGAGRVAQALAVALAPRSIAPPILWNRTAEHAHSAAASIGRTAVAAHAEGLMRMCDAVAIAVSDDALEGVAFDLARLLPPGSSPIVFHVSGRSGAAILEPLRMAGALTAAIHPAMTFTGDPRGEAQRMGGARFAVTGSTPEATGQAERIVALLGGIAVKIAEDRRSLYHAALCHASNHLVTLVAGAANTLRDAGVDDPAGLLAPLVRAALENSLDHGFAGLSGPLLRGDAQTIAGHLATLGALSPGLLPAYRAMARVTLDELKRSGATPSDRLTTLDSLLAVP